MLFTPPFSFSALPLKFALSGALMPAIYTLGNWPHPMWTADGWEPQTCHDPPFQVDWVGRLPPAYVLHLARLPRPPLVTPTSPPLHRLSPTRLSFCLAFGTGSRCLPPCCAMHSPWCVTWRRRRACPLLLAPLVHF